MTALPVRAGGRCTPKICTTVANASVMMFEAREGRSKWFLQAPQEISIMINPTGRSAGPGQPGSVTLQPGQSASSDDWVETDAIFVWCSEGGRSVGGYEG